MTPSDTYQDWIATHRFHASDARAYEQRIQTWDTPPRFHLAVLDEGGDTQALARTLRSLAGQYYSGVFVSVASPQPAPEGLNGDRLAWHAGEAVGENAARALADAPETRWVGIVRAGDLLAPHALLVLAEYLHSNPQLHAVYTDEDIVEADGARHSPRFKPDFDLEWLRGSAYIGGLLLARQTIWQAAGGWQLLPDRQGEFDLALQLAEHLPAAAFGHLADVLYHRSAAHPALHPLPEGSYPQLPCLQRHLARQAPQAQAHPGLAAGTARILYPLQAAPRVSILIAADDRLTHLQRCIENLFEQTDYPDFEVVLIGHQALDTDTQAYLQALRQLGDDRLTVHTDAPATSPSARIHFGAQAASGALLLMLAPSTAALHRDWLGEMVALSQQPEVVAVGARLLRSDGSLQHGGYLLGLDGAAATPFAGKPADEADVLARNQVSHQVSAVSGACLLVAREAYLSAGGFDHEVFPDAWADVDFCLRLSADGKRILWTPFATLLHSDAETPAPAQHDTSLALQQRWLSRLARDPASNPNLSLRGTALQPEPEAVLSWNPTPWNPLPRILVHPINRAGSGEYRMLVPARALQDAGLTRNYASQRFLIPVETAKADLSTIVVQQPTSERHLCALEIYQAHSRALRIVEVDDLVTQVSPENPAARHFGDNALRCFEASLRRCDRLVVPTAPLAEAYGPLVPEVRIAPNYLPGAVWGAVAPPRKQRKKPRVGWSGSDSHLGDLQLLSQIVPLLSREVDWVFFGIVRPELRPYIKQIHGAVPFDAYPAQLAAMDLDLALAPIGASAFNEAKSPLKLLEYGILGYPVVCSDVGPYQQPDFPVKRVANTAQAWIAAIRERIHDLDATRAEGQALQAHVRRHWMLEDHLDEWRAAWTR
ncbi:glycosyltransferase [Pseudothauera nasutitermitis]|uniref:Glycosyltransferase n=1 Tax=Pseudothauera nasutitermitis TaxID=2565930 RepID=A0A4S4B1Z6_9RHOO|nr:glycosyltransferase [Pseudothauera nasutitermitis]THF65697.1 glycosyltransferase [Pseudothauera nasutitermitis]